MICPVVDCLLLALRLAWNLAWCQTWCQTCCQTWRRNLCRWRWCDEDSGLLFATHWPCPANSPLRCRDGQSTHNQSHFLPMATDDLAPKRAYAAVPDYA